MLPVDTMMRYLLLNVLTTYVDNGVGFAGVMLDSLPNPVEFYEEFGFQVLHGIDYDNGPMLQTYPMFLNIPRLVDSVQSLYS